jgi:hypothetical protein
VRQLEQLITASRRATNNLDFSSSAGVQDEEFIQALNDAQEEIHSIINTMFPTILMKVVEKSVSIGVDSYSIPSDCYMGTRIDFIEYSSSGLEQDYYPIRKGSVKERINGQNGNPAYYIRQGTNIIVQPAPQQGGKLRITYQQAIPVLDIRRAQVASVVLTSNSITSLTLDTTVAFDELALEEQNFITIVDKNGVIKMQDIPVDGIDGNTGVVTVTPGFTFQPGETIVQGDYALRGKYSTTHSKLPDVCEKYLLEYCNMRIFMRDSSTDQAEVGALMQKIEATLRSAFAEPDNDPDRVAIISAEYLGYDL